MTNEMIKAKAVDIKTMDTYELFELGASIGTSFLDAKSKMYLYVEIEKRQLALMKNEDMQGAEVVVSELKMGEI